MRGRAVKNGGQNGFGRYHSFFQAPPTLLPMRFCRNRFYRQRANVPRGGSASPIDPIPNDPHIADSIERYGRLDQSLLYDTNLRKKRSEEHTSELQSLMRISYAVFCLKKKKKKK